MHPESLLFFAATNLAVPRPSLPCAFAHRCVPSLRYLHAQHSIRREPHGRCRLKLPRFFPGVAANISAILFAVQRSLLYSISILAACASVLIARATPQPPAPTQAAQQQAAPQQQTPAPQQATPPQTPAPTPVHTGPLVILDPGHGGADPGARGPNGAVEKESVLLIARIVRVELERQGFRVLMTRYDDSNPSYDDRAAVANAHRDAIFISIHIASTGTIGTVHTYYYHFSSNPPAVDPSASIPSPPQPGGLALWEEAQQPYTDASHRFADILELDLAQHLPGSPATSSAAPVRELRSVALPAVAVEFSSVLVTDPNTLLSMGPPLATSLVRAIQSFRAAGPAGGN